MIIYTDNAATTGMSDTAIAAPCSLLACRGIYGNPSSLHSVGQRGRRSLQGAGRPWPGAPGCDPALFTSGGGGPITRPLSPPPASALRREKHIVSTAFGAPRRAPHPEEAGKRGFEVECCPWASWAPLHRAGGYGHSPRHRPCDHHVRQQRDRLYPAYPEIGAVCKEKGVISTRMPSRRRGHLHIDVKAQNIDMLSLSGHSSTAPRAPVCCMPARASLW